MFKQPRVPEYRESEGTSSYIRKLVLFLKDFCLDCWTAVRSAEQAAKNGGKIDSVNGKTGEVVLNADDVGALPSDGTAVAATKLKTARTIRTNLGSTSAASFDGTANITPGVTGTLPIGNGGTGATTAEAALTKLGAMADYGRGTELWDGSWSSGNITVPNTSKYIVFKVNMSGQGTSILAVKTGNYIRGIGGYATAAPTISIYHFAATFSGNTWTFVNCLSLNHVPSGSHEKATSRTVSTIIGLC